MGLRDILERVKADVEGVVGVGRVHLFTRAFRHQALFVAAAKDASRFASRGNIWSVTRGTSAEVPSTTDGLNDRTHLVRIVGLYEQDDPQDGQENDSEGELSDLVEDGICPALRNDVQLYGGVAERATPPSVESWNNVDRDGRTYHQVVITMRAVEPVLRSL